MESELHNGYLCRALETAIVVCYARPFTAGTKIGSLHRNWPPLKQAPNLHAELLRLRNKVYAHTDKTEARQVVDAGAMLGLESTFTEGWHPIRREAIGPIIALAAALEQCLGAAVDERVAQLRLSPSAL